jgi:hypothetical protein
LEISASGSFTGGGAAAPLARMRRRPCRPRPVDWQDMARSFIAALLGRSVEGPASLYRVGCWKHSPRELRHLEAAHPKWYAPSFPRSSSHGLLTGWSLVRIRPGEPNISKAYIKNDIENQTKKAFGATSGATIYRIGSPRSLDGRRCVALHGAAFPFHRAPWRRLRIKGHEADALDTIAQDLSPSQGCVASNIAARTKQPSARRPSRPRRSTRFLDRRGPRRPMGALKGSRRARLRPIRTH